MKKLSTRKRLLLVMIPMAVLPLLFVSLYSFNNLFKRMLEQERNFYKDIINQTASNIDFYYNQYAISFIETAKSQQLANIITYTEDPLEIIPHKDALLQVVAPKFRGLFFLMNFDNNKDVSDKPHKLISLTSNNFNFDIRVNEFIEGSIYKYLKDKKDMNPIFCVSPAMTVQKPETR